jgi:UDP-N-acetylmuramyl pentapeptide phosphotransferase/UDP-N-acetylglucosamine-1-phosphate transferase
MDDFLKVKQKNTKGVSAKLKLLFQIIVSGLIVFLLSLNPERTKEIGKYTVDIRNVNNQAVQTIDLGTNAIKTFLWDGKDYNDSSVPAGDYRLFMGIEDKSGNKIEEFITNCYWAADYGLLEFSFGLPQAGTNAGVSNTITPATRVWKLNFYGMDYFETESMTGTFELPTTPDIFFTFYVPFYSKPLFTWPWWLGILFFMFALVSFSNATNLADGLDGLAAGMGIMLYIPFGVFAYVMGNSFAASYLLFPYLEGVGEVTIILTAMMGGLSAFLWYNVHPAEVFMGDTGSIAIGGTIATVAIILKMEVALVIAGFMFVLEAVSVMLQVFWFKRFNKRIFKMAPIHHHFELSGWKKRRS